MVPLCESGKYRIAFVSVWESDRKSNMEANYVLW